MGVHWKIQFLKGVYEKPIYRGPHGIFVLLPPTPPSPPPPPFSPPNDLGKKIFEQKWIKYLEILSFYTYMCTISEDHDIWFLKYKVQQTEIFVILGHFLPFQPPDNPENQNFKTEKNSWRYYHFTHLQHKWQSYDAWLQRHGAQQRFFCHFGLFFSLLLT